MLNNDQSWAAVEDTFRINEFRFINNAHRCYDTCNIRAAWVFIYILSLPLSRVNTKMSDLYVGYFPVECTGIPCINDT